MDTKKTLSIEEKCRVLRDCGVDEEMIADVRALHEMSAKCGPSEELVARTIEVCSARWFILRRMLPEVILHVHANEGWLAKRRLLKSFRQDFKVPELHLQTCGSCSKRLSAIIKDLENFPFLR